MRRVTIAMVLALGAGTALAAEDDLLKVDAATQARLGVATAQVKAARREGSSTAGFARGIDVGPLAVLDSEIEQAQAAYQASKAEADRTRALNAADQAVSARAAEAAAAQARIDQAKLDLLRQRLGLEWGPAFARMSNAQRHALIADIAIGKAALVRVDVVGGASPTAAVTIDLGAGAAAGVQVLGPARTADARLQSTGVIGVVRGPAAVRMGVGLQAPVRFAAGGGEAGVLVPREAVLRNGGQAFVYVKKPAGFEHRALVGTASTPGGIFAAGGLKAGEAVVVRGAAALYTVETAPEEEDE